jgi:outer membrane protein TolC
MNHLSNPLKRGWPLVALMAALSAPLSHAETLEQALDLAVKADRRMAASERQIEVADNNAQAARALAMPQVSLSGAYVSLSEQPAMVLDLSALSIPVTELPLAERSSAAWRFGATLPIYTGGRISNTIEAADHGSAAATQDRVRTEQEVRMDAAEAYANVLRATHLLNVADSGVQTLKTHERDVNDLREQGLVALNDVLAVQVALANATQDRIRVANALDMARAAYNRLLGRPLDAEVVIDEVVAVEKSGSLAQASEQALATRAELQALEHQMQALRRQADAARGASKPTVAITAGYDHLQNPYLAHEGTWGVLLGVNWTLFDGGLARHQAGALDARSEAVADLRRDAASKIELQVRNAWLSVQESRSRIDAAQTAMAQADENLRVARDRYQSGVGTNTEVLDAETLRVRSLSNHYGAVYDNVVAVMRLRRSIGNL